MAHVHHSHKGADLSEVAKTTMEKSGEQWTMMRSAVFEALASFDRPASAYDIAEKVSQDQGRRVAANSV
jgi:Fur family zinc uptake transcriptional regulator